MKTIDSLIGADAMTLAKASLFRKLRALTRAMRKGTAWRLDDDRIRHGDQCPLTFVGGYSGGSGMQAAEAATKLGLKGHASEIMGAADHFEHTNRNRNRLRRILLRAAGLKEVP